MIRKKLLDLRIHSSIRRQFSALREYTHDNEHPLYFDYQATTPMDPRVVEKMMPFLQEKFGNPHSRSHHHGWEAEEAVEEARAHIAKLINADPKEIFFTSGATESNNLALKGIANFYKNNKKQIVTLQTEHKCVLDSCRWLEQRGFEVKYLPVQTNGIVDLDVLERETKDGALVSIMGVNNEIGVVQPLHEIGEMCKRKKAIFHSDCAQMMGKMPLDVRAMNINAMSITGHKIYGPKGIGALYVQRKPRVRLEPLMSGGGQERGLRSGTLPTFLCVGFGEACRIALIDMEEEYARIKKYSDMLLEGIKSQLPSVTLNGDYEQRYPGNLNLSFECVEGESLLMQLKQFSISSGSACTSASLEPSYVLRAIAVDEENAHSSLRFGIGRFTTEEDVKLMIGSVVTAVNKLRDMSPLWEMVQEGVDLKTIQWTQDH